MENLEISDSQITASTIFSHSLEARNARLNFRSVPGRYGSWATLHRDLNQWLQVDFAKKVRLVKVATQGRWDYPQWVTSYSLSYSMDGNSFQVYKECGEVKVSFTKDFGFVF